MKRLFLFPTPYPDEIFYSILCRYHDRCASTTATQANLELWGRPYGKRLFLPDGIEDIVSRIPENADLSTERFINGNTIFPLLRPFLTHEKNEALVEAMTFGNPTVYNIIGFVHVFTLQHRHLRYCKQCVESDIEAFGEPYWHRVHQIPGVYYCPLHNAATVESDFELGGLPREFHPLLSTTIETAQTFEASISAKLLAISREMSWLLQHGCELGCSERTTELYDNWLRVKGYREHNGKTIIKKLAQDIVGHYGKDFLQMLDAYNSGACIWIKRIIQHCRGFQHPLYHLLLICLLAGSAEEFFAGSRQKAPEYLPFGSPPYPCRNHVCDYNLKDVIARIEIIKIKATPRATFTCPHCGFTYRRKGDTPKEKQYSGQIDIVDYGWKWELMVSAQLSDGESPYLIAQNLHCDVRTIHKFGIEHGLLLPEQTIKRQTYVAVGPRQKKPGFETQRLQYRQRWLDAIAANPAITRNQLRLLDSKADQWLHRNDAAWVGENSPPSRKSVTKWADHDDECVLRVKTAIDKMRSAPGNPKRISITAISKAAGIPKLSRILKSGKLPKTKAIVDANAETLEQWQKKRIILAVQQMRERDELLTAYKVRRAACVEDKKRALDGFIAECIESGFEYSGVIPEMLIKDGESNNESQVT